MQEVQAKAAVTELLDGMTKDKVEERWTREAAAEWWGRQFGGPPVVKDSGTAEKHTSADVATSGATITSPPVGDSPPHVALPQQRPLSTPAK